MWLARIHRTIGIITIVVFLLTGVYMATQFPGLYHGNEIIHYQYRANHVYVLLSGLVNLGLGLHLAVHPQKWKKTLQYIGSMLVLMAPLLLVFAFFMEPPQASPRRPLTGLGVLFALGGTIFHVPGRTVSNP